MKLLYINTVGKNHRGQNIYEFLFGRTTEIEYGENWDALPANACDDVTPPPVDYIHEVGLLVSDEIELECVQHSDFAVVDAVDDIVAMAWEKVPVDGVIRLVFHFGDELQKVQDKLYARDLELDLSGTNKYVVINEKT